MKNLDILEMENLVVYISLMIYLIYLIYNMMHFLMFMLIMEFCVLFVILLIYNSMKMFMMNWILLYYLMFFVLEGVLGLMILILMVRYVGNDYLNMNNLMID